LHHVLLLLTVRRSRNRRRIDDDVDLNSAPSGAREGAQQRILRCQLVEKDRHRQYETDVHEPLTEQPTKKELTATSIYFPPLTCLLDPILALEAFEGSRVLYLSEIVGSCFG